MFRCDLVVTASCDEYRITQSIEHHDDDDDEQMIKCSVNCRQYSRQYDVHEELWDRLGKDQNEDLERQHGHAGLTICATCIHVLFTKSKDAVLERPLQSTNPPVSYLLDYCFSTPLRHSLFPRLTPSQ